MSAGNEMVRKAIGKWGRTTHAHFGWRIEQDVIDLGGKHATCEMCERTRVRFVYIVSHPDHETLRVGCECGGWMIGDTERAQRDIKDMRRIAARKAREAKAKAEAERAAAERAARAEWPRDSVQREARMHAEVDARIAAERKAEIERKAATKAAAKAAAKAADEARRIATAPARAASDAASARARRKGATEHEAWQAGLRAYLKTAGPLNSAY